jgi:hypothetical protein
MRYPNPKDENEVCCYGCSDYLTARIAVQECAGGAWFCPFCLVEDRRPPADQGAALPRRSRQDHAGRPQVPHRSLTWTCRP